MKIDVRDCGTIWLLKPLDDEAKAFMDNHLEEPPAYMRVSGSVAFDWRQGRDFAVFFQGCEGKLVRNGVEVTLR